MLWPEGKNVENVYIGYFGEGDNLKNKSNWDFYGVKIIKQVVVEGEPDPSLIDEFFDHDEKQTIEESLMLVHAQSFDHAYKIAEKRAVQTEESYQSIYGQQVTWKYVEAVDCFLVRDNLVSGAEVYACFHTINANESAREFIDKWFSCTDDGCRKARRRW